ncbi:MAG: phage portal protein [Lachnospiraceae bacterium]|jgi:HK97 family phage portal protein|nr:phage portal protein [Lachnospiraceae bacterium]
MNLWERIMNAWNCLTGRVSAGMNERELREWLGISEGAGKKLLSEVTYYTCLKMLSETIGKLPLKYYQETAEGRIRAAPTDTSYVLSVRPNPYMTPSTLWSAAEMNCQHYGNGYIWLRREYVPHGKYGGEYGTKDAWVLQSSYVTVLMDDMGIFGDSGKMYYQYTDSRSGKLYLFRSEEIIHIKTWFSLDGVMGRPVRDILKYTIEGAAESQTVMNNMYKNGMTASMAMQYVGDLDEKKRVALQKKFADVLCGPKAAGKVIPIPTSLTLTPLKMNLTDAQFFELKKYSALQIAGAFGIKPNHINNYERSSYANSETQQLAFLVDTMSYRLKQYEEEINAKALLPQQSKDGYLFKFNEKSILRTDSKTQMENLSKAVNNGIYTPNEAREYLDLPMKEGGNTLMVNGNYIPITDVGKQYEKEGGEGDGGS